MINLYNENFSGNDISDELKDYLIDGSRREDDVPRWMNHFYDPVYNRGLTIDSKTFGPKDVAAVLVVNTATLNSNWLSSKKWAQNSVEQISITYNPILKTTIAGLLAITNPDALRETDFTWERAIKDYLGGDKERALDALGHILHLIEDASVPDHTRNDPHPNDSPYEIWTAKFTLDNPDGNLSSRLENKKPVILESLNSYFDGLAKYSNNGFYSKDTIGTQSGYESPQSQNYELINGYYYAINNSEDGSFYYLMYKKSRKGGFLETNKYEVSLEDQLVKDSYWSLLSVKSVQYGAGVINLFFQEVEKAKNDQSLVKEAPKSFFASLYDSLNNFVNELFRGAKDAGLKLAAVAEIGDEQKNDGANETDGTNGSDAAGAQTPTISTGNDGQDEDAIEAAKKKLEEETINSKQLTTDNLKPVLQITKPVQVCKFVTDKIATHLKLIINEVAWMGSLASANDEWIELKNISGSELDISGWQVLDKNEDIKITFGQGKKVPVGGLLLLERTDDNSVLGINADVVYAGALSNSDEGLRVFDNECNLMDEIVVGSEWTAGIAEARRAMERQLNLSWNTYGGNGENFGGANIMGTPKKENSGTAYFQGGSIQPTTNQTASVVAQPGPTTPSKILISEVQITGGTGKSNNDFIELYNPNNFQVNLNGYRMVKRTKTGTTDSSIKSWTSDIFIPAKGYYLWANSDYSDIAPTPDVRTSTILANDNGIAIRFGAEDTGTIIDSVAWGMSQNSFIETQAFAENPIANQSISRQMENDTNNNSVDFVKSKLTPKNSSVSGGFLLPDLWSAAVVPINHIVISEFYTDRTGTNKDFVELYNPNAPGGSDIDISSWSLQVLSANATSTDKIAKKNFEANNKIPASGFFLIGIDKYAGSSTSSLQAADMTWASGSLNSSDGATIFLVSGTSTISDFEDSRIVDQVAYGGGTGIIAPEMTALALSESGKSWERKAYQNSNCLSAQGGGEFLGNGCDTDNNVGDFEAREILKPQSSANFIEPRNAPAAPQNFRVNYSTSTLNTVLNWDISQDYINATSTIVYELSYATSTSSGRTISPPEILTLLSSITGTTTHSFKIKETGVGHYFSIVAKDKEGLSSLVSTVDFSAVSPFTNFYFYKDSRSTTSKKYLLDFYYDNYPFVPSVYGSGGTWKIAVFYLNKEAPDELALDAFNNWQPTDLSGTLGIKYENCSGSNSEKYSLILPDASGTCNNGGGIANGALRWEKLEDLHLLLELTKDSDVISFNDNDYVSVGLYSFYTSGAGNQIFKLSALNRNKYYFQDTTPIHQSPSTPANLEITHNTAKSLLRIIWDKSTDADTLDNILKYQINYSNNGELNPDNWIDKPDVNLDSSEAAEINNRPFTKISVEPDKTYLIGVRTIDDFGNVSGAVTGTYSVPPEVLPYGISNVIWGNIIDGSLVDVSFDANSYPFMTADKPSVMIFYLNQTPPINYSFGNGVSHWDIGGSNSVLKLKYSTCGYGIDGIEAGLFMHNSSGCSDGGWGLKKDSVRSNFSVGQNDFVTRVSGVLSNGGTVAYDFTTSDYFTIGFYEFNEDNIFKEVGASNNKIYFQGAY